MKGRRKCCCLSFAFAHQLGLDESLCLAPNGHDLLVHGIQSTQCNSPASQSGTQAQNTSLIAPTAPIGVHEDLMDVEATEIAQPHLGETRSFTEPTDSLDVRMNETEIPDTVGFTAPGKVGLGTSAPEQPRSPAQALLQIASVPGSA